MDWSACIICKKTTPEKLSCPQKGFKRNAREVYAAFLGNVEEFRQINALPVDVEYGTEGTVETFVKNNASWHRSCHQKFNNSKLNRQVMRKRKHEAEAPEMRRSKRQSVFDAKCVCIFCEKTGDQKLHNFQTFGADQSLRKMATDMQDDQLLSKITGG